MKTTDVFSIDDFSDLFWQSPPATPVQKAIGSDWTVHKFLDEEFSCGSSPSGDIICHSVGLPPADLLKPESGDDGVVVPKEFQASYQHRATEFNCSQAPPLDSDAYAAFLKSKLDIACHAVAMSLEFCETPLVNGSIVNQTTDSTSFQSEAQAPDLPSLDEKDELQIKQITSGSSREDSIDDELEGDAETIDPKDIKRAKRMQSNRESARRSRWRKLAQLNELETQVAQLREERITLLERYSEINKNCNEASVDNKILKANIQALRAKVKMAEEQVKQLTGLQPMNLPHPILGKQSPNCDEDYQLFKQPPDLPAVPPLLPHIQRSNNSPLEDILIPSSTHHVTNNKTHGFGGVWPHQHHHPGPDL